MGLFDRFKKTPTPATWYAPADYYGAWAQEQRDLRDEYESILGLSPAEMWRSQPYLRTVVTFLARNIAQLGLHTYRRVDEDDRQRVRTGGIVDVLAHPNPAMTTYELIYGLVADLGLYDHAYWLVSDDPVNPLSRLPVTWVTPKGGDALAPKFYRTKVDDKGHTVDIPAEQVLAFHGWSPLALTGGSTPVAALKMILAEQVQAARYREAVWMRGGKVGAVLSRPPGAPAWSPDARTQFKKDWDSKFTGAGPGVGGTPMLEDGMTLNRVDFSAKEMEYIDGSRLALNTVASVYHVNPTMIGLLDNANYSNVREFRRMLYGDTLGPIIAQIEDRLNTFLLPVVDPRPNLYVEFNIEEKLKGSFEEQTQALQSSVGRPWMTANEARALRNMPAVDDGDGLVTPLNVLVGGQASPTDATPDTTPDLQPAASRRPGTRSGNLYLLKGRVTERQSEQIAAVLRRFFKRQQDADRYGQGGKWDEKRWNVELADDLHAVALSVTDTLGKQEAATLGFDSSAYDPDATVNFLRSVAERRAENINRTTKDQLDAAVADEDADPADVYEAAVATRAPGIAVGLGTMLAGFATYEAAGQLARSHQVEPTKTWVTGGNPRSAHASLNGETVPFDEAFSNGLMWPGDSAGDAAEVAGCNCTLQLNVS